MGDSTNDKDVKFKPLKRVPFGPQSSNQPYAFPKPPPIPPKDFYPRKPEFWKLYGTEAYGNRNLSILLMGTSVTLLAAAIMYFRSETPRNWFKFFTGAPMPTMDEVEARLLAKRQKFMAMELELPPHVTEDSTHEERRLNSRFLGGHLVDGGALGYGGRGTGDRLRNPDVNI